MFINRFDEMLNVQSMILILQPTRLQVAQAACSRLQAAMPCNANFGLFSTLAIKEALSIVANHTVKTISPMPKINFNDYEYRYLDLYANICRMNGESMVSTTAYIEFIEYFLTEAWDKLVETNYLIEPYYEIIKVSFREFDIVLHLKAVEGASLNVGDFKQPRLLKD